MKKYSKLAYILLVLIVVICGFFIYRVFAKDGENSEDVKGKAFSDVKFIESNTRSSVE